jgi:hypothetical protein
MKNRQLLESLAEITVTCEPEDSAIEGNASAIDDETDKRIVTRIRKQLSHGNDWAWCVAGVHATYAGETASAYLGFCSYKSEADFIESSGYFDDMRRESLSELAAILHDKRKMLQRVILQGIIE